jgi:hypothetical protein
MAEAFQKALGGVEREAAVCFLESRPFEGVLINSMINI